MNSARHKEFLKATAGLLPYTRWASAFSFKTEGLLPAAIRNLPLKLAKMILAHHHNSAGSVCKSC